MSATGGAPTVLSLRKDGSDLRVVARGLRNPYGLAFQPGTGRLYATVNGQDEIGTPSDPEPAEMLVVVRRGAFYGWPRCWPNARTLRLSGKCARCRRPPPTSSRTPRPTASRSTPATASRRSTAATSSSPSGVST